MLASVVMHAEGIRLVGTTRVDISPILKWKEDPSSGERPMKHWKFIKVLSVTRTVPWNICAIKIEGKETKNVYLNHIDNEAVSAFENEAVLLQQISELSKWIDAETKRLRDVGAHESEWEYGSPNFISYQKNQATLRNKQDDLYKLRSDLETAITHIDIWSDDLAMFTGQFYNKMEVWDIGQKQ